MRQIQVLDGSDPCGNVALSSEGLYCRFAVQLWQRQAGVPRVWCRYPGGWELLGVAEPDGDTMALTRTRAMQALPEGEPSHAILDRVGCWRPWSGSIAEIPVRHAVARPDETGNGLVVAVPYRPDQPLALLPVVLLARLGQVWQEDALFLSLDVRGQLISNPTGQWSEPKISE